VTASVLEAATQVLGIALRSKNLKETYVKVLRKASASIAAGATLMSKRMAMGEGGENLEILEELREENQKLRALQDEMKKEMEELKE
ncbi:hypothetical protein EAI_08369, partial [Harpegnathos saltator]